MLTSGPAPGAQASVTPAEAFVLTHAFAGVMRGLLFSAATPPRAEIEAAMTRLMAEFARPLEKKRKGSPMPKVGIRHSDKCLDNVWQSIMTDRGDMVMATRISRTEKLDLRLTAEAKHTLTAAAQTQRRSLSEFVLESALGRAEEALADRRVFQLPPETWKTFIAALDAAPRDLPRLRKLLNEPSVFSGDTRG